MGEIRRFPLSLFPGKQQQDEPEVLSPELLKPGFFTISFNNKKRQGTQGLQTHTCQGALFEDTGHVHLDTSVLQVRDFTSLGQATSYLEQFGDWTITAGDTV
jgi:hypothetical protein